MEEQMDESAFPNPPDRDQMSVPQFRLGVILIMFAWLAVWFTFLIYGIGGLFIPEAGQTPTWFLLSVIVLGTGAELAAGVVLLRREGHRLTYNGLRSRIRLQWPKGWKSWVIGLVVFLVAGALSMGMGAVNRALASVPGFVPPEWWPNASNPTVSVTSAADFFPDIHLVGNYGFAGPLRSLPLAMAYHWLDNFLLQTVFLLEAAAGM
jgi:hypothetical protein